MTIWKLEKVVTIDFTLNLSSKAISILQNYLKASFLKHVALVLTGDLYKWEFRLIMCLCLPLTRGDVFPKVGVGEEKRWGEECGGREGCWGRGGCYSGVPVGRTK